MAATAGRSSSAARMRRSSASSQSPVGLPRDDRERPPGAREGLGQAGGRIDLQRRAHAEAAAGALHERGGLAPGRGRQHLAEEHDLRPQRPAAHEALRGAPGLGIAGERGRHVLLGAAGEARGGAQVPVHLHRLAAGGVVQAVDVLRHDACDEPAQLEPSERGVRGVRAGCSRRRAARPSTARRAPGRARACPRGRRPSGRGAPRARRASGSRAGRWRSRRPHRSARAPARCAPGTAPAPLRRDRGHCHADTVAAA